jgi:hypothetical protein
MPHADGCLQFAKGIAMSAIFGVGAVLAVFALGFVLGRIWEIRQDLRCKTESGSLRAAGTKVASQISDRFLGGNF